MINQQLMNEVPMLRSLSYAIVDLVAVIVVLILLVVVGLLVALVIWLLEPDKHKESASIQHEMRIVNLEEEVEKLEKESEHK